MENKPEIVMIPLYRCSKCKQEKPRECFYKNKNEPNGLHYWCIQCRKAYNQQPEVKERNMILARHRWEKDKEKVLEYQSNRNKAIRAGTWKVKGRK